MVKIYLDTEFDGFAGRLLSLGMVGKTIYGIEEWYEVLDYSDIFPNLNPWVVDNVLPVLLEKSALPYEEFRASFLKFMMRHQDAEIHVDWPSDAVHFFSLMLGRNHLESVNIPCTFVVHNFSYDYEIKSEVPHHALYDARMIQRIVEYQHTLDNTDD